MTLAIFKPDHAPLSPCRAFAQGDGSGTWTFFKIGKRGGKLYRNAAGTIVYESNLPEGATKVERELTPDEQAKQTHIERKERRKATRAKREAEQSTSTPNKRDALPLSPQEKTLANKKLAKLKKMGANAARQIAYTTKGVIEAKKQAFVDAYKAISEKDQGTSYQRVKKAGVALTKVALASYRLHAKRYGVPTAVAIEGAKALLNVFVSAPVLFIPGAGQVLRSNITGPAVDYASRKLIKQGIRFRQWLRGRRKQQPKPHSQATPGTQFVEVLDFDHLVRIVRTSLHVDAIKARVRVPRVTIEQVARSLESLLDSIVPDEQAQRKAA